MRRVRGVESRAHWGHHEGAEDERVMTMRMAGAGASENGSGEDKRKGAARRASWVVWVVRLVVLALVLALLGAAGMTAWSCWLGSSSSRTEEPGHLRSEDPFLSQSQHRGRGPPHDVVFMKEEHILPGNVLRQVDPLDDGKAQQTLPEVVPVSIGLDKMLRVWAQHRFHLHQPSHPELLIGVLSARGNLEARNAQRETWGRDLAALAQGSTPFRISLRFFLGSSSCPIPPEDRASKYGCEPQPLKNPVFDREVYAHDIPRDLVGNDAYEGVVGMDFRLNHPITLTRLGAFDSGSNGLSSPITVKIWHTQQQTLLASRTITDNDGLLRGGVRYVEVDSIVLPKDTTFTVTAEGYGPEEPLHSAAYRVARSNDAGGIVEWLPTSRKTDQRNAFPQEADVLSETTFQFAAGTFAFRSQRVAPPSSFSLPWKDHVSYPVIHLTSNDVLTLAFEEDTTLYEVATREQMQSCNAMTIVKDWTPGEIGPSERKLQQEGRMRSHSPRQAVLAHLTVGTHYFISHDRCQSGMKMEVNVTAPIDMRETLEKLQASRYERQQKYTQQLEEEEAAIQRELKEHGDVVVIPDLQDTYRTLPQKLQALFTYATADSAAFVLKTDDDTLLDVKRIAHELQQPEFVRQKMVWWGSFRAKWPVERAGKWAEPTYPGKVYPPFACGSGSVVSRDVAAWIAQSSSGLHAFQGEDVSLGIWLQAAMPTRVDDPRWQCFGPAVACRQDLLSLPELSPAQLRARWHRWTAGGSFCSDA